MTELRTFVCDREPFSIFTTDKFEPRGEYIGEVKLQIDGKTKKNSAQIYANGRKYFCAYVRGKTVKLYPVPKGMVTAMEGDNHE